MSQGSLSAASPFTPWKPHKFLIEKAVQEEQAKWETVEEKFEVKDAEFEENQAEMERLGMNPHQFWGCGVKPHQVLEGRQS